MILAVTDTETTGIDESDEVCELAIVALETLDPKKGLHVIERSRWSSLVRPTVPVSYVARAAHHIMDAELSESWTMEEMLSRRGLPEFAGVVEPARPSRARKTKIHDVVFVSHVVEFDYKMLLQSRIPREMLPSKKICTWKCAQHLWPDAPKYSNQVLRYYLGLNAPRISSLPPHRALPDALDTAGILTTMLLTHSVEDLIRLTDTPILLKTCNMGEHAGKPWSEVDIGFLRWIIAKGPRRENPRGGRDIGFDEDTRYTVQYWITRKSQ